MRTANLTKRRAVSLAVAAGLVTSGTLAMAGSSYAVGALVVAPKTGPITAGGVLSVTGTGFQDTLGADIVTSAQFNTAVCPNVPATPGASVVAVATLSVVNDKRLTVTQPALTLTASKPTVWNLCTYKTSGADRRVASGKYTVYGVPTIGAGISPASGAASGGGKVTITGTDFTSTSKVRFGSVYGTNVKVTGTTSLTVTAPALPPSGTAYEVAVETEGGASPTPGTATWNDFTSQNAISVSPSLGKPTAVNVLTVKGVGFKSSAYDFAGVSKVFLTKDPVFVDTADPTEVCGTVQVVSDTELVCRTDNAVAAGAYTVLVVADDTDDADPVSVASLGSTYTSAAY